MASLDGKVALVTGARRGIGRGIALELASRGADVAVNDLVAGPELDAVAAEIRSQGRRSLAIAADVTQEPQVTAMVQRVVKELGQLDVQVNNAGTGSVIPFLELAVEEWQRVLDVNLKAVFLGAQAAARQMVAAGTGGVILNIGSVQSRLALPGRTHYAPSKRAVEALTANLASELGEHGIRVNCIHPGLIDTPMTETVMTDPAALGTVLDRIALRRAGTPSDIGKAAAFLASDDASYITGASLQVDGGFRTL